jgi:uncharacterized membrane protein
MDYARFKKVRTLTALFILVVVSVAVLRNDLILALSGVLVGMAFLILVRKATRAVLVDERVESIARQAARISFAVSTNVLAFLSLLLILLGRQTVPPQPGIETLGTIISYIALFNLAVYALSYKFLSQQYGETDDE